MIGIVILNYLNWWDTVELIDSIKKQSFNNFEIIIVDNASGNESVEKLSKLYKSNSQIHLLVSKSNQGFARGNNIGIEYAIRSLKINKILLVNNDVLFTQKNYLENLLSIEYSNDVGAIGTKILDSNNKNQNPVYNVKSFKEACVGLFFNSSTFRILRGYERILRRRLVKPMDSNNSSKENTISSGSYMLHGSIIFLTENYLNIYPGLYPKTFMFFEENILQYLLNRSKLKALYYDDLVVKHKEDQSSNAAFDNIDEVKQTMLKNSWREYLKLLLMTDKKVSRTFLNVKAENEIKF
ncbi:glycosyltransferase [Leuconostoc lactis]|uniref:glycosyltransferase n=1 Tax=Leuconostoc lactis TaxID=1246 RepID=UPI001898AE30|nr:glycosyltransferase [Leuconostoc lactis]